MQFWNINYTRHVCSSMGHYHWGISESKGNGRAPKSIEIIERSSRMQKKNTQGCQRQTLPVAQFTQGLDHE